MENYREIILGIESINYVRQHLATGLTLSTHVLQTIDLNTGQVATGMPEDMVWGKLYDFDHGGILASESKSIPIKRMETEDGKHFVMKRIPRAFSFTLDTVERFLRDDVKNILILENANARPTDPVLKRSKSTILTFHNEVYHLIIGKPSKEDIRRSIVESESLWTLVGFMTSLPTEADFPSTKELSLDMIGLLAENTQKILIGAYDGEGFLIWQRGK